MELYPRDRVTNTATIPVAGSEIQGGFSEAVLRVYANGVQVGSDQVQSLTYTGGQAPFSFAPTIPAELASYDFELLVRNEEGEVSVSRATNIVAGDVFIIQGQSNATALEYGGSAEAYESPFVRTFVWRLHSGVGRSHDTMVACYRKWQHRCAGRSWSMGVGYG